MNENDLSDIIKKIAETIGSNDSIASAENTSNSEQNTNQASNSHSSNIDIETLLKIKKVMDKINNTQNSPSANLLLSLKPYLRDSRKDKVDQYIKLLNISNIMDIFKSNDTNNGGDSDDKPLFWWYSNIIPLIFFMYRTY